MHSQTAVPTRLARLAVTALVAAGLGLVAVGPAGGAPSGGAVDRDRVNGTLPRLRGTVGPGFTIKISDDEVPAGRYRIRVRDRSTAHNFHLIGTDISRQTPVPKAVRTTWRVRLREGTYRIQCDPHPVSMRIDLVVTA